VIKCSNLFFQINMVNNLNVLFCLSANVYTASTSWQIFYLASCIFNKLYLYSTYVLGMTVNWITPSDVQGITLNCFHIFIVTGSFLYRCVMRPASQLFLLSCIYLRIFILPYLATCLGTYLCLYVLMCRKAVNQ